MFDNKYAEVLQEIEKKRVMVLATSLKGKVTARMMSVILYQGKLYFQTDIQFEKTIKRNQNVALCIDNIQIEGIARCIGPTIGAGELERLYKEKHQKPYTSYSHLSTTILAEVTIQKVTTWCYKDTHSYRYFYDIVLKEYQEELYV